MFYVRRFFLMVLFFENQTLPGIKGASNVINTSKDAANTKPEGFLHWIPNWCRKGYNRLFGEEGVITSFIPGLFGHPKKEPVQCCCRLPENENQSTSNTVMNVRDVPENENEEPNKCVQMVGNAVGCAGGCVLGVGWFCGKFIVEACKEIVGVTGALVYGVFLGCIKVGDCFTYDGPVKEKKPSKKKQQAQKTSSMEKKQ